MWIPVNEGPSHPLHELCKKSDVFFRGYRFEHPKTEQSVSVKGWSYLWAGLFGVGYVMYVGYGSVWKAAAINIVLGAVFIGALGVTSFVPPKMQLVAMIGLVPVLIWIQGAAMVDLIRMGFRRRGWMIMQG